MHSSRVVATAAPMESLGAAVEALRDAIASRGKSVVAKAASMCKRGASCAPSYVEDVANAIATITHVGDVAPAAKIARRRQNYNVRDSALLRAELLTYRDQYLSRHGSKRGWREAWIDEQVGEPANASAKQLLLLRMRNALRKKRHAPEYVCRRGLRAKCWISRVASAALKRSRGAGRGATCDAIGDELWCWFVDRINNVKGRVGSALLLKQAALLKAEAEESWRQRCDAGDANPMCKPKLPKLNASYVVRWRRN